MSIFVSLLTAGANSHQESSETFNGLGTDFVTAGVVGAITNTSGVAPTTGGWSVNAQGTPDMTVAVGTGVAWVTATPTSQNSQVLRVRNAASANVTISANSSGSTKYDWVYISVSATAAANPALNADDVATLVTSRSSSATVDNGTPPTYGLNLAVVTVANGASSITNASIADKRVAAVVGSANSSLTTYSSERTFDHVASGLVWTADAAGSTLLGSMTSGVVYISGSRNTVAAVTAHAFTASKDTYIDVLYSSTGIASVVYTEVANNAASPALAASSVRIGIVVTGVGSIAASTSINQGQETRVLPIASSIPYAVTDSLGNLICPRDPNRKVLGYRQILTTISGLTSQVQLTGLSVPVIIPTGRKVNIKLFCPRVYNQTTVGETLMKAWDGVVNSGTLLGFGQISPNGLSQPTTINADVLTTPTATSKTYNVSGGTSAGTAVFDGSTGQATYIKVELV